MIPIFLPPVQFAVKPKQAVDNLFYLEGAKLFLRVCVPRNTELNGVLKKTDPIGSDYTVTSDYLVVSCTSDQSQPNARGFTTST